MVFKILEKGLRGFPVGKEMISISRTSISLGKTIGEELLKKGFVEVWLDRELNKVGFKSSKDSVRGFKIQKREDNSVPKITSKLACKFIPRGLYDATKENDLWVIKVSEIADNTKTVKVSQNG